MLIYGLIGNGNEITRANSRLGRKSLPAAASKIVTLTISPTPKRNAFGGVLLAKAFDSLGEYTLPKFLRLKE